MLSISVLVFITRLFFVSCLEGTRSIEICNTKGCVKAAANILNSMDTSKDPCDNFFEYACGQWKKDNPIPDDRTSYYVVDKVAETVTKQIKSLLERNKTESAKSVNLVKEIYRGCMDIETRDAIKSQPLISTIQKLGNWPLLDPNWTSDKLDTTDFLAQIFQNDVTSFIFGLFVYPVNATINTLRVDKGSLGLNSRDFYMNDSLYRKQMDAYRKLIADHIRLLTTDLSIEMTPQMEADVDGILNFERQLANITVSIRNVTTRNNKWTIASLSETVPFVDWLAYFKTIMPPSVFDRISDPGFSVIVFEPEYMLNIQSLLKKTDKKVLVNYGIWRLVQNWSTRLDTRFDDIYFEFNKIMYGTKTITPQSKNCVAVAVSELNMAVGALYAEEHFNENDKIEALSMEKNLQQSYKDIISDLDWMDNTTKRRALEKLDAMLIQIGYPDYVLDSAALDLYYSIPNINDADNYFNLIKKVHSWKQNQYFYELLKPLDRSQIFETNPTDVMAYNAPARNTIAVTAGELQPPLFESDFPKAVNYGGIGSVMGKMITYEFDFNHGSYYDKFGKAGNWWSTSTKNNFKPKMNCLVNQYGNFTVPEINANLNGKTTFTQNLVINGGIKNSFKAYKAYLKSIGGEEPRLPGLQGFTNEQIFFLSFANIYCGQSTPKDTLLKRSTNTNTNTETSTPNMFLVIGALINLPEFSSVFGCPKNSFMNPDDSKFLQCLVW